MAFDACFVILSKLDESVLLVLSCIHADEGMVSYGKASYHWILIKQMKRT
jgi:hypothetical protein